MSRIPVIAIFDIGKTNKKLLLFDEQYNIVWEESAQLPEISDEEGFPCEDLPLLVQWMKDKLDAVLDDDRYTVTALNFSAYGASFVHLDDERRVVAPLYNYLKPFSEDLKQRFSETHGALQHIEITTASPFLGNLNSGLQLFRLKHERPALFSKIRCSLHLPNYLSYLFTGHLHTELTSIGCHTLLWDFNNRNYHQWVKREGLTEKFPSLATGKIAGTYKGVSVGLGYHDSSAALSVYLQRHQEPFLLVSTGTWCISMNRFNDSPLTAEEFEADCLCYLTPNGQQVKSSRYFGGDEHERLLKQLLEHYPEGESSEAFRIEYALGLKHIVSRLKAKMDLVLSPNVRTIYIDGGFSRNELFIQLLSEACPALAVIPADVPQASAIGAAMLLH